MTNQKHTNVTLTFVYAILLKEKKKRKQTPRHTTHSLHELKLASSRKLAFFHLISSVMLKDTVSTTSATLTNHHSKMIGHCCLFPVEASNGPWMLIARSTNYFVTSTLFELRLLFHHVNWKIFTKKASHNVLAIPSLLSFSSHVWWMTKFFGHQTIFVIICVLNIKINHVTRNCLCHTFSLCLFHAKSGLKFSISITEAV